MNILGRLAFFFVAIPLVELAILVELGRWIGFWPTVAIVFVTGFLGAALARAAGMRALTAFRRDVAEGRVPGRAIFDGLAVLLGGAFLLTPGLLTDMAGLLLLFPPTRRLAQRAMEARIRRMIREGTIRVSGASTIFGGGWPGGGGSTHRGGTGPGGDAAATTGPEEGPSPRAGLDPDKEIRR